MFSPKIEAAKIPAGALRKVACPMGALEDRGVDAKGLKLKTKRGEGFVTLCLDL